MSESAVKAPRGAAVVAVGDELLSSGRADLNGPWLGQRLEAVGLSLVSVQVVGDDERELARILGDALARHRVVITTGGLGPTLDDVTRQAVARALGRPLVHHEPSWERIVAFFAERGRTAPEGNQRQALLPEGATVIENARGTAPGFRAESLAGSTLFVLPGPPGEMRPMADEFVLPAIATQCVDADQRPGVAHSQLFGLGESDFADRAGAWLARDADPVIGVCAHAGVLEIKATSRGGGAAERAAARLAEVRERFAEYVLCADDAPLEAVLVRELAAAGRTLAVAESCTGGLVAGALTDVPGSSAVFEWGAVTYADRVKTRVLGVPATLLARHGAVSEAVAGAMARGARAASGADLAVATTGVAGPDGGSEAKPVGLVWFALASAEGVVAVRREFPRRAGRERIRRYATQQALALVLWALRGRVETLGAVPVRLESESS